MSAMLPMMNESPASTPIAVEAWFDGAISVNPNGHAACGAIIKENGNVVAALNRYIGVGPGMTVNVAEYCGLLMVFEYLSEHSIPLALIRGDSQMVIHQMRGLMKARSEKPYVPYYLRARAFRDRFPGWTYQWVPREENDEADVQSKLPLAGRGIDVPSFDRQFHDAIERDRT